MGKATNDYFKESMFTVWTYLEWKPEFTPHLLQKWLHRVFTWIIMYRRNCIRSWPGYIFLQLHCHCWYNTKMMLLNPTCTDINLISTWMMHDFIPIFAVCSEAASSDITQRERNDQPQHHHHQLCWSVNHWTESEWPVFFVVVFLNQMSQILHFSIQSKISLLGRYRYLIGTALLYKVKCI